MVFGGIIRIHGRIHSYGQSRLVVEVPSSEGVKIGDSIAINGVCLTVVHVDCNVLHFDVCAETQAVAWLPSTIGAKVHVELALREQDRVGGHCITGHVHCTGEFLGIDPVSYEMWIALPESSPLPRYKDGIALDGVSLTVAEVSVERHAFRVALIPHTVQETLFGTYTRGRRVNVELVLPSQCNVTDDEYWMGEAVREGDRGRLTAPPNPWVGAVLLDGAGREVSRAYHVRAGEPHAERLLERTHEGVTLYVTLEPCHHHGRTPPCDAYLLDNTIFPALRRIIIGWIDPDERVNGSGLRHLQANFDVVVLNDPRVYASLAPYLRPGNKPYVVCKLALSTDGAYADPNMVSHWITSKEARAHGHGLRAQSARIVVGRRTQELDHPRLTVRHGWLVEKEPQKIVARHGDNMFWARDPVPRRGQIVLVEGGPTLVNAVLAEGLADELVVYRAPDVLGAGAYHWKAPPNVRLTQVIAHSTFDSGDTMTRFHVALKDEQGKEKDKEEVYWDSYEDSLASLRAGGFVIVMDDVGRENEGDLMVLASRVTPEQMTTMMRHTTGMICVAISKARARALDLSPMVAHTTDPLETPFTVSVDARGTHTGVSAAAKTQTCRALVAPNTIPDDLQRPGHIFPLVARDGGLVERQGHTEAGVTLARALGEEGMVLAELYNPATGMMLEANACRRFANAHGGIPMISVAQIATAQSLIPFCALPRGTDKCVWELGVVNQHRVLRLNLPSDINTITPVRIHSDCFTGDVLASRLCDCGAQLDAALTIMEQEYRCGVIVFPGGHEGRGIGLEEKVKAYRLQADRGLSTYEANRALGHPDDARDYSKVPALLALSGLAPPRHIVLLTNNPDKVHALEHVGYTVSMRPLHIPPGDENTRYLETKMQHFTNNDSPNHGRVVIVQSEWYAEQTSRLVDRVKQLLPPEISVLHVRVPGAHEIPGTIARLGSPRDIYVAVGALVKGETDHYEGICSMVEQGLMALQTRREDPLRIVHALITCQNIKFVEARCTKGDPKEMAPGIARAIMALKELKSKL